MAAATILRVFLVTTITRIRCEPVGFNNKPNVGTFGDLLKPPPPPSSNIIPVPFHGGAARSQRQNIDLGYHYQPPPPPPPPPHPQANNNFKFPAPFYKQYNFNFVPPPQPFTTTPSPSLFQKVSGWLFPSTQTSFDGEVQQLNGLPAKRECNPCNSMPWIPVLRYDTSKKLQQHVVPTYGAPSPTANIQHAYQPHPFNLHQVENKRPGIPHQVYGPPSQQQEIQSVGTPSSTYGPPSATYSADISSQNPPSSSYGAQSSSVYSIPSSSYGIPSSSIFSLPSSSYEIPSSSYGMPSSSYGAPSSSYSSQSSSYGAPSSSYGAPSSSVDISSSTFGPQSSTYGTPSPSWVPSPTSSNFGPVTNSYDDVVPNYQPPQANDAEVFRLTGPDGEQQLPKVSQPTGFRNSYGEPINSNYLDIPYPVSAAEGSTKIKTEVLLNGQKPNSQNDSFALAKPAPFSLNRGRNIHTLQPVALPNLSVSPLPPIFNARPFRTIPTNFFGDQGKHNNNLQTNSNKVTISQSVPVAEFTQSVYPPTFIQSPIIDVSAKTINQTKAYRNIPNSYMINQHRDITSQASEDHINTKTNSYIKDISFESTGSDVGNDLYDIPSDIHNRVPSNHRDNFADLRGASDDEVDKYRTDNNLQSIDSPLLYLKPSAPHKDFGHFLLAVSTTSNTNDYELYDEHPTTPPPQLSSYANKPEESSNDHGEGLSPPPIPHGEKKPKVVQIIIPYTTGQSNRPNSIDFGQTAEWASASEDEYQARKVPSNTENYYNINTVTDSYSAQTTTTEDPSAFANDNYESDKLSTPAILNDLYDVREPPFDIIKLQNNIDDWTEQQFSQHYRTTQKAVLSGKYAYAKQIPDDYLTTISPLTNYVTIGNYDFYDHEGSGSVQHTVTENIIETTTVKPRKEYNSIQRGREKPNTRKNKTAPDYQKQNIGVYTAASSFRSTTTTPAPWGKIETSISPLTKEKVYVVTSKPWHENPNITDWYAVQGFESKKTLNLDNDVSASDNLPFKSPRFLNRPSFGATSSDETLKSDSSYGFSKNWHQRINELEAEKTSRNVTTTPFQEGSEQAVDTNVEEVTIDTTTAGPLEE